MSEKITFQGVLRTYDQEGGYGNPAFALEDELMDIEHELQDLLLERLGMDPDIVKQAYDVDFGRVRIEITLNDASKVKFSLGLGKKATVEEMLRDNLDDRNANA